MSDCWKILGISSDADARAIKRAYAKKLKSLDQAEDPAGFMALREAYEQARQDFDYRDRYQERETPADDTIVLDGTNIELLAADLTTQGFEIELDAASLTMETQKSPPAPAVTPDIMDEVKALMKSPWGKDALGAWKEILNDQRIVAVDDFIEFEENLLSHLLLVHGYYENRTQHPQISPRVAHFLYSHFGWHAQRPSYAGMTDALTWLAQNLFVNPNQNPNEVAHIETTETEKENAEKPQLDYDEPITESKFSQIMGSVSTVATAIFLLFVVVLSLALMLTFFI